MPDHISHANFETNKETKYIKDRSGASLVTDESIMQFGKHKGKLMADVPDDYLLWLLESMRQEALIPKTHKAMLLDYLLDNEDALIKNIKE